MVKVHLAQIHHSWHSPRSGWQCQSLLHPSNLSIARPGNLPSRNNLLRVVLLTQAVEIEAHVDEQVQEQLKDGTPETAPQAVVDRLRTIPKTVMEFRSSARKSGSRPDCNKSDLRQSPIGKTQSRSPETDLVPKTSEIGNFEIRASPPLLWGGGGGHASPCQMYSGRY